MQWAEALSEILSIYSYMYIIKQNLDFVISFNIVKYDGSILAQLKAYRNVVMTFN